MSNPTKNVVDDLTAERPRLRPLDDDIFDLMRRRGSETIANLAKAAKAKEPEVNEAVKRLMASGKMLVRRGGKIVLDKEPATGAVKDFVFESDSRGRYKFGFYSDQHICSKHARLDVGEDLFNRFAEAGVKSVLNAGNWIDGEARFNKHDLTHHGIDEQCWELAEKYPRRKGITTYAIAGDDHEGWYAKDTGLNIGQHAEKVMRDAGRRDWVNLGFMEAFITLRHHESGAECKILVIHPGGGSSYAVSYRPQKIVEGFSGGEKPAAILIGHYHKMSYNLVRSVHAIQCGCGQDQTTFMRKKGLEAHLGGGIVEFGQDARTGALSSCRPEFFQYFVQGYYNDRWSYSGEVVQAKVRGA